MKRFLILILLLVAAPAYATFGGAASAASGSVSLTGVTAGSTIVVFITANNGTATAAAASDSQGSYTREGTILASSFAWLILTNANAGTHSITASLTGDTVYKTDAAWWSSVGGVDNSAAAFNENNIGSTGTGANVITSGSFTTTTANDTVILWFFNDTATQLITAGTSPHAFTLESTNTTTGNSSGIEDFAWSSSGSINPTAGISTSVAGAAIAFALAPASGNAVPPSQFFLQNRRRRPAPTYVHSPCLPEHRKAA